MRFQPGSPLWLLRHELKLAWRGFSQTSLIFVIGAVSVELVLGFIIALALFNINEGRKLANAIILLPMIITPVITALLWRYLLDPQFGVVAQTMTLFGGDGGIDVWGSTTLALPGLILVDIWQWTPFVILVLHAGMLSISSEQFEAAAIDGANARQRFVRVTLPLLKPVLIITTMFSVIWTFSDFQLVYVLTAGGPSNATHLFATYAFNVALGAGQLGSGASIALSMLPPLLMVIAALSLYLRRT